MIRWLTGLLGDTAERSLRDVVPVVVVAMSVTLFCAISLGFGTLAAYGYFRALVGGVGAALILCAAHGLAAITIWAVWTVRRRQADRERRAAVAAVAAATTGGTVTSLLLKSLAAAGAPPDQELVEAAIGLGRELSPMRLLALALVGGFIIGRKLDK